MPNEAPEEAPRPVPAAFIADTSAPTGYRFECTACGWTECRRVLVKRPGGAHYTTEFVACGACQVVFHWAAEVPLQRATGAPVAGVPDTYMVRLGAQHDTGMTEEQLQVIKEAADRARKGRSWKARKR